MKATGIVRRLDELGRIVIPKELRKKLNFVEKETQINISKEEVYLKKYSVGCMQCGEVNGVITTGKVSLCRKCLKEMVDYVKINTDILG
ncbi:AbrB/MazE/SpoVT family DNA-binding domain-containing protein [Clostridium grantii]|uniref:Transcriptional regulator, AbrB family n=1 Tax=Clostridium grantii DSM 8605 TaxID=1121316 RepID=A0A1M5R280_9CLOT|nr:AbrB/MazE/SpoVT family DNA-binding domain-containing protein [Clostridium grantii]SHH20109.1 transcriptional regulator, AbrB family [Clostridium grantii DSM 8605]